MAVMSYSFCLGNLDTRHFCNCEIFVWLVHRSVDVGWNATRFSVMSYMWTYVS